MYAQQIAINGGAVRQGNLLNTLASVREQERQEANGNAGCAPIEAYGGSHRSNVTMSAIN